MGCGLWLLEVRMIVLHCMYALRKYYVSEHRSWVAAETLGVSLAL